MTTLLLGGMAIVLATTLAGAVGFAYGLVSLPLLLALGIPLPDVVVVNLTIGLCSRLVTVWQLRQSVDLGRASLLVLACVPGLAAGVWARGAVETHHIEVGAGVLTIVAATFLACGSSAVPRESHAGLVGGAGAMGGFLGATTSLNGIPPALVFTYFRERARNVVADLAVYFVAGNTMTLAALTATGNASIGSAAPLVAAWLPGAIVGNLAGVALGSRLPYAVFRRATLVIIFVSGGLALSSNL